jgi:diguanylate cyclase (GGDEF)-like protein
VVVAFACGLAMRLIDTEIRHGDIEPLTGLLTRNAFYERVTELMGARRRTDDRYLVVIVMTLDAFSLVTAMAGAKGGNRARAAVGRQLCETVRRDAILAHVGEAEYLMAELFTTSDPSPLVERIRDTIRGAPFRMTASIGGISTPMRPLANHPAVDVLEELLTVATAAMVEARSAGGNRARLILCPALTTLNDINPDRGDSDKST